MAEAPLIIDPQVQAALSAGITPERIVLDPGYGFAKNLEHNCQLLAEQAQLQGNQAYREAGHLMPVPLKILDIPYEQVEGY